MCEEKTYLCKQTPLMSRLIAETSRLKLRELVIEDSAFIQALLNSEGWLRYIGDRQIHDFAAAERYLSQNIISNYQKLGFGFYAVVLKEQEKVVGICGLAQRDYLSAPDLGFAFLPDFLGQGFGYESSVAMLQYAGNSLNINKLYAIVLPENKASVRLLEKLGFRQSGEHTDTDSGELLTVYTYEP